MKPFNLERALAGDPVGTRDGRRKIVLLSIVKPYIVDVPKPKMIQAIFDNGTIEYYGEDGQYYRQHESNSDLVMLTQTPDLETERKEFEEWLATDLTLGTATKATAVWIAWKAARGIK